MQRNRSFEDVEFKAKETEFFLFKFLESNYLSLESKYYFSAFLSSARTLTLSLQAVMGSVYGFKGWYETITYSDKSKIFLELRNDHCHTGFQPLNKSSPDTFSTIIQEQLKGNKYHFFVKERKGSQEPDIINLSEESEIYFKELINVIFQCYEKFKCDVDPTWYFTKGNFELNSKTVNDAFYEAFSDFISPEMAEIMFQSINNVSEETEVWKLMRDRQVFCPLNEMFLKYLDKQIQHPDQS